MNFKPFHASVIKLHEKKIKNRNIIFVYSIGAQSPGFNPLIGVSAKDVLKKKPDHP